MLIRDANANDIPAITLIHNDAVANTTAIWDEARVDEAERLAWLTTRQNAGFPVLAALDDRGVLCGYASYGPWRTKSGYRHSVEHSVYVHVDQQGRGTGRALMQALIELAGIKNIHVMIGAIEADNTASIRLHETLGFEATGHMREVGTKFGRWLDLVFMQKILP